MGEEGPATERLRSIWGQSGQQEKERLYLVEHTPPRTRNEVGGEPQAGKKGSNPLGREGKGNDYPTV